MAKRSIQVLGGGMAVVDGAAWDAPRVASARGVARSCREFRKSDEPDGCLCCEVDAAVGDGERTASGEAAPVPAPAETSVRAKRQKKAAA